MYKFKLYYLCISKKYKPKILNSLRVKLQRQNWKFYTKKHLLMIFLEPPYHSLDELFEEFIPCTPLDDLTVVVLAPLGINQTKNYIT